MEIQWGILMFRCCWMVICLKMTDVLDGKPQINEWLVTQVAEKPCKYI